MNKNSVTVLLFIATLLSGLLAGETVDRLIVGVPAWRHVPIQSWALYSRNADLSARGTLLYPIEAIGSFLLLVWIFLIVMKNSARMKQLAAPVFTAVILSASGLFFTFFAAPWMLSLKNAADDPVALQNIFDHFYFWSTWRGIVQALSFPACVYAMSRNQKINE